MQFLNFQMRSWSHFEGEMSPTHLKHTQHYLSHLSVLCASVVKKDRLE